MFGFVRRSRRMRQLEEALGWYADESHWRRRATNSKGSPRRWEKSPAARDRGGRARVALGGSWARRLWQRVLNQSRWQVLNSLQQQPAAGSMAETINDAAASEPMALIPARTTSTLADSEPVKE